MKHLLQLLRILARGCGVILAVFGRPLPPTLLAGAPQKPRGHCTACGYNLHGLSESRCPECGTPFAAKAQPSDATNASNHPDVRRERP